VPEVLRSFVPDSMSSSVLDQSGLLYWLGTVGGTEEWQNPALMRHSVDVQLSSVMADSKPAHFVVGRESVRCVTRNEPNQWLLLDLHGLLLRPSHYALRHYLSWDVEALRSWRFEASRDRVHWKLLRQHVDDTTLYTKGQTAVFALTGDPASSDASEAFSYFRVVMTGKNSNLHWYLACSGMELYGDLIAEPKSAADPNSDSSDDDESASNVAVDSGKLKAFVDTQLRTWNLLLPASGIGTSSSIVSSLDIDQCGLFYWLGADGHTSSWKNPADSSVAVSFSPSLQADSQPAASLTARTLCRMVTKAGSMIMLPSVTVTIPKPMVVTHYTLRHYSSWDTEALRSWCFEGSTDGQEWKVLHEVTDDTTLSLKGQCGTWTVPSSQSMLQTSQTSTQFDADALSKASFTQYRLKMISVNSNKNWYLALCGLELYGFVLHSEPSASVPLQSDNVMSRESTGSSTTSTVSISNESNLISERLGLPSDAPWFSAVSMLEKTIHALRPALSSVMTSTSSSVRVQIPLPSSFIAQVRKNVSMGFLCKILADGDFDRELSAAHALWTEIADEQLVRAVNIRCEKRGIAADSLLADTLSFTASELAHFDALAQHSERSIRLRLVVLQELNRIVVRTLPLIDLACAPGASTLCDAIREARSLIFWTTKRELWESVLEKTKSSASPATIQLQLDVFRANTLKEKRRTDYRGNRTLFGQAYQQLKNKDAAIYRLDKGKQVYKTLFVGQFADDYGGPYRASIVQMCAELQDMVLPLFIPVPNARARVGQNRECWVPRPTAVRPLDLSMLEFLGQLFGAAVRSRVFMDLNLPSIVWKQLVQQPVTEADVLGIDVLSFKIVDQLETMVAECDLLNDAEAAREMFESIDARYVAMGSDGHEVPLIPQGHSTPITLSNCRAFIKALRQFRLAEFRTQVEAIRRGLATVVPYPMLSLLTWDELQVQVCGRPKFDVDLLFSQTVYEDCSLNDLHIQLFWRVLRERFDDNERSKFLAFVWGQSRLPLHASDFERKFKIMRYVASESNPAKFLPISHTCFFSIELPKYSTLELMHSRLLLAITHCDTIDADGTSNGIANARLQMNVADDDDAGPSLFA
jgi:hypothetical protein